MSWLAWLSGFLSWRRAHASVVHPDAMTHCLQLIRARGQQRCEPSDDKRSATLFCTRASVPVLKTASAARNPESAAPPTCAREESGKNAVGRQPGNSVRTRKTPNSLGCRRVRHSAAGAAGGAAVAVKHVTRAVTAAVTRFRYTVFAPRKHAFGPMLSGAVRSVGIEAQASL